MVATDTKPENRYMTFLNPAKMQHSLIEILIELKTNPSVVVELYEKIFCSKFLAIVRKETEDNLNVTEFSSYETRDGIFEIPLFTENKFIFENFADDAIVAEFGGLALWKRLLEILENKNIQIAINPGQSHGIRLTKEMILGMVNVYGK